MPPYLIDKVLEGAHPKVMNTRDELNSRTLQFAAIADHRLRIGFKLLEEAGISRHKREVLEVLIEGRRNSAIDVDALQCLLVALLHPFR